MVATKPKAKPAAKQPAARGGGGRLPSEALVYRAEMFRRMTQGAGKPMLFGGKGAGDA